ncbi:hypothetical protein X975_18004, partial [Stegodyphus mimosarum]
MMLHCFGCYSNYNRYLYQLNRVPDMSLTDTMTSLNFFWQHYHSAVSIIFSLFESYFISELFVSLLASTSF